jgi:hypothetical protein
MTSIRAFRSWKRIGNCRHTRPFRQFYLRKRYLLEASSTRVPSTIHIGSGTLLLLLNSILPCHE